jgi:hypothetical protein
LRRGRRNSAQAVLAEFFHRPGDLLVWQNMRRADLQCRRILLAERLDLDREPHRFFEIGAVAIMP